MYHIYRVFAILNGVCGEHGGHAPWRVVVAHGHDLDHVTNQRLHMVVPIAQETNMPRCKVLNQQCYNWVFNLLPSSAFISLASFLNSNPTHCDKFYQRIVLDRWCFPGTAVSSTNKADRHDVTELLLKVALNTITLTPHLYLERDNSSRIIQ